MEKKHFFASGKASGITRRWVRTTLSIVVAILVLVCIIFMFVTEDYYSSTLEFKLNSQYSNSVADFFLPYTEKGGDGLREGARKYIAGYAQKDAVEVWVLDGQGKVVMSSSGFDTGDEEIPDFEAAEKSESRSGEFKGKNGLGEDIRAVTYLLPQVDGEERGAVRYIVSTEEMQRELFKIGLLIFSVMFTVIALIILSGLFFLQSIVNPVREINEAAKRIAKGDLSVRMPPQQYKDELSELCENINDMAEQISSSDKLKSDFIATVSHEMKTPLTAIKGWGETLLASDESDPAFLRRGTEIIIGEAERLGRVVEDLLDLSKINSGRMTMKKEKIDILAELDETVFVFKDRSVREGIELEYSAPDLPAPALGDPERLRQVFVNILDNAFKYTEQGGRINVYATISEPDAKESRTEAESEKKAEQDEDDGAKALLKIFVEDTGCGISKDALPKVKNKFYKSNISVRGSGIGLAVCDEIVNMHGGSLKIESSEGVGTCVIVSFPVDSPELSQDKSLPQALAEAVKEDIS